MRGKLGGLLAVIGLSASLESCALVLGEGGRFDEQGTGSISTTSSSGVMTGGSSTGSDTSSSTSSSMSSSTNSGGGIGCPPGSVDMLADDFNDSARTSSLWAENSPGSMGVADHTLTLYGPVELFSTNYYSIIDCQISTNLKSISGAPPNAHFNLKNSAGATVVQIFVNGNMDGYISFIPENPIKNCFFNPLRHIFWRFRATSSDLFIETSGTGYDWTDEPCGATNGEGKFSLSKLGLTDGKVEVHLGTEGDGNLATFNNINK